MLHGTLQVIKTHGVNIPYTHISPADGTVTYTSTTSVTCTGWPFTVDDANCLITGMYYKPTGGSWYLIENNKHNINMSASSNVITVTGLDKPFASGDTYILFVIAQQKAYDSTNDLLKIAEQSPLNLQYSGPTAILAAAQTLTGSYADVGPEIPCWGYRTVGIWLKITVNQATALNVQVLAKHTASDTSEYNLPISIVGSSSVSITPEVVALPATNNVILLMVNVANVVPYIQIQMSETDAGTDATVDSCFYTAGY